MRVNCLHGFFIFEETKPGQISDFMRLTGFSLSKFGKNYTFEDLADIKNYSLITEPIGTFPAIKTFAGTQWEVFEANNVVYDFTTGEIVPISSITLKAVVQQAGNYFISPGLILPGSFTTTGLRVKSYSCHFLSSQRFVYSEVEYV